jgi:hypothetical protein
LFNDKKKHRAKYKTLPCADAERGPASDNSAQQHHSSKLKSKESRTAIFINKLSKGRTNPMPILLVYKNSTVTHARFTAPEIITIQYNKSLLLQYTAVHTNCQAEILQYKLFVFMGIQPEICRFSKIPYCSKIFLLTTGYLLYNI